MWGGGPCRGPGGGGGTVGGRAEKDVKVRTVTLTKESPTNSDESGNFQLESI